MKHLQKDYAYSFILELTRLVDVIHDRLEVENIDPSDRFDVYLKGHLVEEVNSLEDVLRYENSRKKPIERLSLTSSGQIPGQTESHVVTVDFGVVKRPHNSAPNVNPAQQIAVSVSSPTAQWASRMLSEVEEQVERTRIGYGVALIGIFVILVTMVALILVQARGLRFSEDYSKTMWLDDAGIQRVNQILSQNKPLTDDEVREITTIQMRNLVREQMPSTPAPGRTRRSIVLFAPIVSLIVCVSILLATCYPKKVFLWGDGIDRYNTVIHRRRIIWGIIIGIMVIGIFSRFLFESVASVLGT